MASRSDKVRVGIIRCDTHGYWYAPLFEKPDPELYKKGHRGCHYYFYKWEDPHSPRINTVPGMAITRVFDDRSVDEEGSGLAEGLSEAYHGRPKVCDSLEEASDDVDLVYIADCNYEGKDHLRLATPGLKKGVPHFVDKPFAFTLDDAREMIELANKHNTAVMCSSLLRQSPFLQRFRARLKDIAPVGSLLVPCAGGPGLNGLFHGLSIVQNVLGEACEWVESMGPVVYDVLRLHYPGPSGGIEAVLFSAHGQASQRAGGSPPGSAAAYHHCAYHASAYGAGGSAHSPLVDDYLFYHGGTRIVRMAKRMAQTNKPPIPYEPVLEVMEIIEAARLAHNKGRRVYVQELR